MRSSSARPARRSSSSIAARRAGSPPRPCRPSCTANSGPRSSWLARATRPAAGARAAQNAMTASVSTQLDAMKITRPRSRSGRRRAGSRRPRRSRRTRRRGTRSFARSRQAWESSVRVDPRARKPQTSRSNSSFVNTRVGDEASVRSSANSFAASSTRLPRSRRHPRRRIDLQLPHAQQPALQAHLRAAQHRRDPQPQLRVRERLGHVVVQRRARTRGRGPARSAAGEHDERQRGVEPRADRRPPRARAGQLEPEPSGSLRSTTARSGRLNSSSPSASSTSTRDQQLVAVGGQVVGEERPDRAGRPRRAGAWRSSVMPPIGARRKISPPIARTSLDRWSAPRSCSAR